LVVMLDLASTGDGSQPPLRFHCWSSSQASTSGRA
jgi:hypothetical protein